jgi:hypothetical protein
MDNGRMCFHTFTHFMSSQEGAMGHIDRSGGGILAGLAIGCRLRPVIAAVIGCKALIYQPMAGHGA